MQGSYYIIALLKFGQENHIMDMFQNGTIYMNTVRWFKDIEDNHLRGDKHEGIIEIRNWSSGKFGIPQLNFKGSFLHLQVRTSLNTNQGNIFSLYCISSYGFQAPERFYIDERVKGFGTHFLLIKNIPKFLSRIRKGISNTGYKYNEGFVYYYEKEKINGSLSVFDKSNEYEYQKEFRFFVQRESTNPFIFSIGSLKDIAEVHDISSIRGIKLLS